MQTGQAGIDLIKQHEGCYLAAYKCPAGVWTIGYGHTGSDVKQGLTITQAMLLYNKAAGKVLAGLTKRRQAERQLFLTPVQEVKNKVDVTQSKVKKLPVIVNGKRYEVDGVFEAGVNYFSVRQLAQLLDATVSNQGSIPVLTKK